MVVHAFSLSTWKAEAGGSPKTGAQAGLYNKCYASQSYVVRLILKRNR